MSEDPMRAIVTPLQLYGQLFIDAQMRPLFGDGKTFVDAMPRRAATEALHALYDRLKDGAGFSLEAFVHEHFEAPSPAGDVALPVEGLRERIRRLWPALTRQPDQGTPRFGDTLLPLHHPYVVPGGRFREVYYWDSYFTMIGLVLDGHRDLAEGMLRNFADLITRYGYVPNGNRSYFLSRSQPPFFFKMVEGLATQGFAAAHAEHLVQLKQEHAYWMRGEDLVDRGAALEHVVRLPDGSLLNRYWDARDDPREESYRDDVRTALASERPAAQVYRDLRAGAESGWDFSSRWCADPQRLDTIETTAIVPIDLNSLMFGLEQAIAQGCAHAGDFDGAFEFEQRALLRRAAIDRWLWSPARSHYVDHHWVLGTPRPGLTAAVLAPLYLGLASDAQADAVARVVRERLLCRNGLVTTLEDTGQQWDAPNGWAPLQWMAVEGLSRYGHAALAQEIAQRWLATVQRVYLDTGRLLEKYDVQVDRPGGGGEYPTQDGFGWTNASVVAFESWYPAPHEDVR